MGKPPTRNNCFLWEHISSFHEQKDTHTRCSGSRMVLFEFSLRQPIFIKFPCIPLVGVHPFNARPIRYVLSGAMCSGHLHFGKVSAHAPCFLYLQLGRPVYAFLVLITQGHLSTWTCDAQGTATHSRALGPIQSRAAD